MRHALVDAIQRYADARGQLPSKPVQVAIGCALIAAVAAAAIVGMVTRR